MEIMFKTESSCITEKSVHIDARAYSLKDFAASLLIKLPLPHETLYTTVPHNIYRFILFIQLYLILFQRIIPYYLFI